MRRYNIINNSLGWLCFVIAAVTYLLTIEPTASFWDCPEFITQGYKLEVGHPPGNPIFMLTARFFVTVFGGGAQTAAIAVNSMSALLSAATILLLFWTITHLVKKLMIRDGEDEISPVKMLVIMGSGICGALAYTWSDTFWFSAVEGEVYAFSSFCTALVFWLILKWENRADNPRSDRYLVLIAYVIGISIAVHLLNLLCIPAIVLVFYYKKFRDTNLKGSLIALGVSVVIIALILFGLVPGFVSVAQRFEVFFVNSMGMSYNVGVLFYALITLGVFIWTIYLLRQQRSAGLIKVGMALSIILSGMPFIGHGWVIPTLLIIGLAVYLFGFCKRIPVRIFNTIILSIFVIFIGYSSYALLLIRSTANTPMNQNAPDNVFTLGSYLNREQYGETPLLTGARLSETIKYEEEYDYETNSTIEYLLVDETGTPQFEAVTVAPVVYDDQGNPVDNGYDTYVKVVKSNPGERDRYLKEAHVIETEVPDGMSMLFPRMYSDQPNHIPGYKSWSGYETDIRLNVPAHVREQWAENGYVLREELEPYLNLEDTENVYDYVAVGNSLSNRHNTPVWQPSFWDNVKYFINYQLIHMYWRYFMWNFAGRQNDIQGNGEPHLGNWITGIPVLDNARLGDQSLLPEEYTTGNAGHNVFYLLPLIMGVLGLVWQAFMRHPGGEKRGIEQFWVIFFLFFMTGIAIVLYLNQPPAQPRERDYAFAGSFYAFAIWIGLGVAAIYRILCVIFRKSVKEQNDKEASAKTPAISWVFAGIAALIGVLVPIQMVSQTWDDHDRSDRYAARDFGMNYLNSLDENAIIFVNGDNDTFPLWYAQEVEGVRTDVKVVNLSYLSQDWYARQVASASYDAQGVPYYMPFTSMDYGRTPFYAVPAGASGKDIGLSGEVSVKDMLTNMYKMGQKKGSDVFDMKPRANEPSYFMVGGPNIDDVYVELSRQNIMEKFGALPSEWEFATDSTGNATGMAETWRWSLRPDLYLRGGSPSQFTNLLAYDIIARTSTEGFNRPVYFASTVGGSYYMGFSPNMFYTGMAQQITPFNKTYDVSPVAAKAYNNIIGKFRWGGLDSNKKVYLDETIRRMISSTRLAILAVAKDLMDDADRAAPESSKKVSREKHLTVPNNYAQMAQNLLDYMTEKLSPEKAPYESGLDYEVAYAYMRLGSLTGNRKDLEYARSIMTDYIEKQTRMMQYGHTLDGAQYNAFMNAEDRNLYYVLTAYSMLNQIDLELAVLDGKVSRYELADDFIDIFGSIDGLRYQGYLLLGQPTRQELAAYGEDDNFMLEIVDLYNKAGINPYNGINKFLRSTGINARAWEEKLY